MNTPFRLWIYFNGREHNRGEKPRNQVHVGVGRGICTVRGAARPVTKVHQRVDHTLVCRAPFSETRFPRGISNTNRHGDSDRILQTSTIVRLRSQRSNQCNQLRGLILKERIATRHVEKGPGCRSVNKKCSGESPRERLLKMASTGKRYSVQWVVLVGPEIRDRGFVPSYSTLNQHAEKAESQVHERVNCLCEECVICQKLTSGMYNSSFRYSNQQPEKPALVPVAVPLSLLV